MKKSYLLISLLLILSIPSNAQMTLAHSYTKPEGTQATIVNLSLSGKKIMTLSNFSNLADTIYFYNMDYSYWKSIPCPAIPGYSGNYNIFYNLGEAIGVLYPSETLFNLDTFLEVAVTYHGIGTDNKLFVINELGTLTDSIIDIASGYYPFSVYKVDTLGIGFQAVAITNSGISIYNLPGTIPCDPCSSSYGIAMGERHEKGISTEPLPNPSSDKVKITFTLPDGITKGVLDLYNANGQKVKSFQIDNRFGYILLDNTQLSSGLYYYNIVANGSISATQKLVLIK